MVDPRQRRNVIGGFAEVTVGFRHPRAIAAAEPLQNIPPLRLAEQLLPDLGFRPLAVKLPDVPPDARQVLLHALIVRPLDQAERGSHCCSPCSPGVVSRPAHTTPPNVLNTVRDTVFLVQAVNVPEPAAGLLALGGAALLVQRRRRLR